MTRHDYPAFAKWLTELSLYFPASKVDLVLVLGGYFRALRDVPVTALDALMDQVVRTCRYFPTVYELRQAVEQLGASRDVCPRCPGGHGVHAGHDVKHYPDGPWCATCSAELPRPVGYLMDRQVSERPLLPERTPEIAVEEAHALAQRLIQQLSKRSEHIQAPLRGADSPEDTYRPRLTPEEAARRHAALRRQAAAQGEEPAP